MIGRLRETTLVRLVVGAVRTVLVEPVARGTLAVRRHDAGVAGIVGVVAALFALILVAIIGARALRGNADLIADTSRGSLTVIPEFLPPALLLVVGVSFALVLAGSQRGHPVLRVLLLIVLGAVSAAIVLAAPSRESSPGLWWGSVAALAIALAYCVAIWWLRTPPLVDVVVLLVALEAAFVLAYAGMVAGQDNTGLRFDIVTVSLLVTYLTMLASPVAFASGLSAVGVGIAAVAWSADFVRRVARPVTIAALLVLVAGWQAWVVVQRWSERPGERLVEAVVALVLVGVAWLVWLVARRPVAPQADDVVQRGTRLGLPVGYGLQSAVLATAVLGLVGIALTVMAPDADRPFLNRLMEITTSDAVGVLVRWLVVAGLVAAGAVAMRRGDRLIAGVTWVSAVVLTSVIVSLPGWPLDARTWSPNAVGDVGFALAIVLAVALTVTRAWTAGRAGYLLVVVSLSALVRQANVLETPMAFLIGGSAVAVLVFGLAWSFLTGGGEAHSDSRWLAGDRRLLVFVGEALYALAITAWAVIGRQADSAATLASFASLAVLTLGTSLVLASAFALAPAGLGRAPEVPGATLEEAVTEG